MDRHRTTIAVGVILALAPLKSGAGAVETGSEQKSGLRVGLVETLFRDLPEPLVPALVQPFGALTKAETGRKAHVVRQDDPLELGRLLIADQVDLGVFQGIEFAWAQHKYPELRPLIIIVNQKSHLRTMLVTRADSGMTGFADLKGKSLALPCRSHQHCYEFLYRQCRQRDQEPGQFFGKIVKPLSVEEALDDVVDGLAKAALVEEVPLECYQRRKPGRFKKLQVVARSEVFPASVIAYHAGRLDKEVLRRLHEGMFNAAKTPVGRQLLTLWLMTGFEPVPADYQETVKKIVDVYPAPAGDYRQTLRAVGGEGKKGTP